MALQAGSRTLGELVASDEAAASLLDPDSGFCGRGGYLDVLQKAYSAEGMRGVRREKRRRLAAIAACDFNGDASLELVITALSDLADASLSVTLQHVDAPDDMAVIGMGKLGGRELNYASDIDVMLVVGGDALGGAKTAARFVQELGGTAPEGQAYRVDTNLRPEGRNGPLLRSLDAYVEYYQRWAKPWEYQALIKARCAAGSETVGAALVDAVRPLVYPERVGDDRISEIRRMKERLESHAVRSARRAKSSELNDVKLGPGGIRDIEFAVQLLQLVHGGTRPIRARRSHPSRSERAGAGRLCGGGGWGRSAGRVSLVENRRAPSAAVAGAPGPSLAGRRRGASAARTQFGFQRQPRNGRGSSLRDGPCGRAFGYTSAVRQAFLPADDRISQRHGYQPDVGGRPQGSLARAGVP